MGALKCSSMFRKGVGCHYLNRFFSRICPSWNKSCITIIAYQVKPGKTIQFDFVQFVFLVSGSPLPLYPHFIFIKVVSVVVKTLFRLIAVHRQ